MPIYIYAHLYICPFLFPFRKLSFRYSIRQTDTTTVQVFWHRHSSTGTGAGTAAQEEQEEQEAARKADPHSRGTLLLRLGCIADVQYADSDDGSNFKKDVTRRYRHSLKAMRRAVTHWNGCGVGCVLQVRVHVIVSAGSAFRRLRLTHLRYLNSAIS
jgi:hypothetical protein